MNSHKPTNMNRINNVFVSVFDTDLLRYKYPEWDALTKREKLSLIRTKRQIQTHNITCNGLHQSLAGHIDPETSESEEVDELALGTDASSFNSTDTSLNNEVERTDITDTVLDRDNGELLIQTFIDSTEANDETLAELGIIGSDGSLFNHAAISPTVDKTDAKTLVVDVVLGFEGS